jgi:hypothetical protein
MSAPSSGTDRQIQLAFAPLHKLGMGLGLGTAAAVAVFVVTAIPILRGRESDIPLHLLAQYFSGYEVTWRGAVIGALWALFSGFVLGWFFAFGRNALMGLRLVVLRARADYAATRDFLDHI